MKFRIKKRKLQYFMLGATALILIFIVQATLLQESLAMQIPLEHTEDERAEFLTEFKEIRNYNLRALYEEYLPQIGANGIIHEVQGLKPLCHDEGHDLGKIIYAELGSVGESLRTCADACYSGCMHGVMMEAFTPEEEHAHDGEISADHTHVEDAPPDHEHVTLDIAQDKVNEVCNDRDVTSQYKLGDCVHGVGHAFMYLSNYEVEQGVESCNLFEERGLNYYCATGAYMEYVTNNDANDAENQSLFYPCDTSDYPAACFRYKMVHVVRRQIVSGGSFVELVTKCEALEGKYRLGCFHGLGNAHMADIALGRIKFTDICKYGTADDQYMCIEGVVERMTKYYPDEAKGSCKQLDDWQRDLCDEGVKRGMYGLDKEFEKYV